MGMPIFLTTIQASDLINQSPRTMEGWRFHRQGPAWHTFGGSVRYQLDVLLDWVDQQRVDPKEIRRDAGLEE